MRNGGAPTTANVRLDALRSAADWWRNPGWITRNPLRRIRRRPRTPDRSRALDQAVVDELLAPQHVPLREWTLWQSGHRRTPLWARSACTNSGTEHRVRTMPNTMRKNCIRSVSVGYYNPLAKASTNHMAVFHLEGFARLGAEARGQFRRSGHTGLC